MLSRRNYEFKRKSIEKTSVDKPWTGEDIALFLEFSKLHPETTLCEISDLMNRASLDRGLKCRVFHHTTLIVIAELVEVAQDREALAESSGEAAVEFAEKELVEPTKVD